MEVEKCENCGARLAPGADGRVGACPYCSTGAGIALDPAALAATLGRDMNDVHKFVEHLAEVLEKAFPSLVTVEKSGFFSKKVEKLEIAVAQLVFKLEVHHGHLKAYKTRAVGGITLKNESIAVPQWVHDLSQSLSALAQENQDAQRALARSLR